MTSENMQTDQPKDGHTPTPWRAFNMVHAERGDAMTPEEIGNYVAGCVRKSIEDGGSADRFLFITADADGGPDICHIGNGPRGPANARFIVTACNAHAGMKEALEQGLQLKGGWREAITELEDFCSEPVRLKNMLAAADQLDAWAEQARAALRTAAEGK